MTLTELSYNLRKILPFFIIFIIFFLIIFYSFKLFFLYLELNKPKEIIVPSIFGKINPPIIKNATSSANFIFTLDTVEGRPITTTDSAKVFFIPKPVSRFGYREKIYLMAKAFGFDTENIKHKLIDNTAYFKDSKRELSIDVGNFNFFYEEKLDKDNLASSSAYLPSKKTAEEKAIDFLKKVGRYPDELAKGTTKTIYIKYDPNLESYINVKNIQEANLIEVDFYRADIDGVPIVSPKFFNSQNYVIMLFDKNDYRVVKSNMSFFEKSEAQYDLYPVKTADLAWEELKNGKGLVIAATQGNKNVVIKNIFIGYFDPDVYQSFLQPVYVFLGEDDFVAYVPAISNQYLLAE